MRCLRNTLVLAAAVMAAGCGKSDETAPIADGSALATDGGAQTVPPPVASISNPSVGSMQTPSGGMTMELAAGSTDAVDQVDSPEWALEEIALLKAEPISDDPAKVGQLRRERNSKIIDLATKLISETHDDPTKEKYFNDAVRQLLEMRLEMALAGQPDDIDALFDDVKNLDERDHNSVAAEEGAFTLVRYAHGNAQRFAGTEPRWFQELSRQARLYADGYPNRADRAAPILFAAARSCEIHSPKMKEPKMQASLLNEATLCYTALKDQFPQDPQGQRAVAILRRLGLRGQVLEQFAGPTLDGKYARIEQLRGKTAATVIVFWSSENEEFQKNVDQLVSTVRKHRGAYLLGVNLDIDELDVKAFLSQHKMPGKQLFFAEGKRRWDNPIVTYWGIVDIPTVWVLDRDGKVVSTDVSIADLDALLAKTVR